MSDSRDNSFMQNYAAGAASLFDIFGVSAEPVVLGSFEDDLLALEADFLAIAADFAAVVPTQKPVDSDS